MICSDLKASVAETENFIPCVTASEQQLNSFFRLTFSKKKTHSLVCRLSEEEEVEAVIVEEEEEEGEMEEKETWWSLTSLTFDW